MKLENYLDQAGRWPKAGRHILAQYDDENIIVYQAYRPSIGRYAAKHQEFGGEFSYSRMSWIKPNFLWMMYRSGWGTKEGQEVILAVTIPRSLFDEILDEAVPSSYTPALYPDHDSWKNAIATSQVRLQWDPDHAPNGEPQERRAIQLGLRGEMLRRFAKDQVVQIEDISDFVAEQRPHSAGDLKRLVTPKEEVYLPKLSTTRKSVGIE
ncbi:MAG: hypothetical protein CMO55_02320 [Verrucomicrobiales bacterium]|nr:hypothetical protein [Verrucomicrobiales bacterium]